MASLGIRELYLPKCKFCGSPISFLEWRTNELCKPCYKRLGKKSLC